MQYLIPDTSVASKGRIFARVKPEDLASKRIVLPIDCCRRAGCPRSTTSGTLGVKGLEELGRLSELAKSGNVPVGYRNAPGDCSPDPNKLSENETSIHSPLKLHTSRKRAERRVPKCITQFV